MAHSPLDLSTIFPFELDTFQKDAIASLNQNHSVVVSAPTGAGKTVIGEYAIHRALALGKRVFYTTPLKALSNQKLHEFRTQFGTQKVGLLTGDRSLNRDAPIVVMTTEIFRNILYGTLLGDVDEVLEDVSAVVLDECHYMNDRQRGTVWEESIIYCPPQIQIIALSATVANAGQLTDWISWVHGPTDLVDSDWRPVPLNFHFAGNKGLCRLLNEQKTKMHPQLKSQMAKPSNKNRRRGRHRGKRPPRPNVPSLPSVVEQMRQRDMLPAIYFIFSRRGCDKAVQEASGLSLVNEAEAAELKRQVDAFRQQNPDVGQLEQFNALYRGIAAHHAGLLPAWKGLVEELFQQGLIKVVFATETLAAGINMPARTTVISTLSKRTDDGHRLLTASEFLQMSGRAGRRGMDDHGHVVTVQTRFEGAKEAAYLATVGADPLVSQFTPSYGMVLNLLQTHSLDEAKALIEKSFGQYLGMLQLNPQKDAIASVEQELTNLQTKLADIDLAELNSYQKLRQRLKEEQRLLKILQQQAQENRAQELALIMAHAPIGTVVGVQTSEQDSPVSAILVRQLPSSGQLPYFICLTQTNRWQVISHKDVASLEGHLSLEAELEALIPPATLKPKVGQSANGDELSGAIASQIPAGEWQAAPEVEDQRQRLEAVQQKIENHPAHASRKSHHSILRWQRRIKSLEAQLQDRKTKFHRRSHHHWEEFMGLVKVLRHFNGLADVTPTPLGELASALRGENELWLGLVFDSGAFDELAPHQLAAACTALVYDNNRMDMWTHYSPSAEVLEGLRELRSLQRRLIKEQYRQGVDCPAGLEVELIGLVEQWALGVDWPELCTHTSLDEGDIVRMLRRTLDILSQIPHATHTSEGLRQNAKRAQQLMDRFPISEVNEILLELDSDFGETGSVAIEGNKS